MIEPANPVLAKMLDRLFASMVNGPAMNCRPHASRQRVDLFQLGRFKDLSAGAALRALLGADGSVKVVARVPTPAKSAKVDEADPERDRTAEVEVSPEDRAARQAWLDQQSMLTKLRVMADDARTYGQDTGVHALQIGFPLLSLPPGTFGGRAGVASRRILAPLAFVPVTLTLKAGRAPSAELACQGNGADRVVPNAALLAWLEQQTGQPLANPYADPDGTDPWREIAELTRAVAQRVEMPVPELFTADTMPEDLDLLSTPRSDEDEAGAAIVPAAVLGLFPASNEGLLTDVREMLAAGVADGPLIPFVRHGISLDPPVQPTTVADGAPAPAVPLTARTFAAERLVTLADPCQAQAVRLARTSSGLVIHGPPGTGKSQTIANVIGDHLAHGDRVLFVCDKRTALDVVADRLNSLGLGDLCATVHDPQRDQRDLYRSLKEQIDTLADTPGKPGSADTVYRLDVQLQAVHDELTGYHRDLMAGRGDGGGGPGSFHHLVGQWLREDGHAGPAELDPKPLQSLPLAEFEKHRDRLRDVLDRGAATGYAANPWRKAIGVDLAKFLAEPMDTYRSALDKCAAAARAADATLDPAHPPFDADADIIAEAQRRAGLADALDALRPLPPAAGAHWANQTPQAVQSAAADLAAMAEAVTTIATGPVDPVLRRAHVDLPTADPAEADRQILIEYLASFDARAGHYRSVRAAVPTAAEAVVLRWMAADPKIAAAARKRLDAAAPLADAVTAAPLDASLSARWASAPLTPAQVADALAALNAYLDVAGSWGAVFQGAKKKAAEPIVRPFGLSLSAASATTVRDFLLGVQKRQDLRAALAAATDDPLDVESDDEALLDTFAQTRDVLHALGTEPSSAPASPLTPAVISTLNTQLGAAAETATAVVARHGMAMTPTSAAAVAEHLHRLAVRARVAAVLDRLAIRPGLTADTPDAELLQLVDLAGRLFALLAQTPPGTPVGDAVAKAVADPAAAPAITKALRGSPARAAALLAVDKTVATAGLFSAGYAKAVRDAGRANKPLAGAIASLAQRLGTVEGVIRVRMGLAQLPAVLSVAATTLLSTNVTPADGYSAVRRHVLAGEVQRRLAATPDLQTYDAHRLQSLFDRFRDLSEAKKVAVRDLIQDRWVTLQRERLLSTTGKLLNRIATDLRRRLVVQGQRATRLRQVIAHGAGVEGGDPLFDLRPVWMASPETVAQLFPRLPIFDVVVFDEASQCRLEEALPVLTRAKRVVIAGDPKQLPPTRFFESAVVRSEEVEAETDQEFFEAQQGEVEDLLTAALGLDVHQSYLDVHYRSRNTDLIEFSNKHFYASRLQAIPAHPNNRIRQAAITLHRADGVYEKRRNVGEAKAVVQIVRELLCRPQPPSVGIACFNMVQRDLIVEQLDEAADADPAFAAQLADARERRSASSSEGLFVKNLENVQGDERDHLIVSTTYGPNPTGQFRRSFGPLGNAGGGRRLNVLVTRARDQLHIVTSIPRSAYATLPDVPMGTTPSGAWLLFAYLAYAEQLHADFEQNERILANATAAEKASVYIRPTRTPSAFAEALGTRLAAAHNRGSDVHWGNDGFGIDLAMLDPAKPDAVTVGVLCDMTRYAGSDDPVEWDVFRTGVHERQGWQLHRVWSPHFFRDVAGGTADIAGQADRLSASANRE